VSRSDPYEIGDHAPWRCRRCQRSLGGTAYILGGLSAMWYRCRPCRISYAVPTNQGPIPPVVVTAREFGPDLLVLGWLGLQLWLWRLWRSRWFTRKGRRAP
jgi:hypothetical protein